MRIPTPARSVSPTIDGAWPQIESKSNPTVSKTSNASPIKATVRAQRSGLC